MTNPRKITIGLTTWIRENDDPEYYNVDGRMYFERIHISVFPKKDVERSTNEESCYLKQCCQQKVTIGETAWYCVQEDKALREFTNGHLRTR